MAKSDNIPSLALLARQYGTINNDQYKHLVALYALKKKEKKAQGWEQLLLSQKLATRYQLSLLKLIREYYVIRRQGEVFGKIAVQKGFASESDIQKALEFQKQEFKKTRLKKLMGDILVDTGVISSEQKVQIIKEQTFTDTPVKQPKAPNVGRTQENQPEESVSDENGQSIELSPYEKEFLRVKALDEEFSASVVEKGLANESDVAQAKEIQESAFQKENRIKILGDIMVSLSLITLEQKDIILAEQGREDETTQVPVDAKDLLEIATSDDELAAWVSFDEKNRSQVTLPAIKSKLEDAGIVSGIYPDAMIQTHIDAQFTRFPIARKDNSQMLGKARGLTSQLDSDLTARGEKRKGEPLIQQQPQWQTVSCENIYGRKTTRQSPYDFTLRCGSGTRLSKDKVSIIAAKTGVPAVSVERFVYVHPIINVLEDADQRYGAIEAFANLTVSGIITGAYPVTAGHVNAREIRGGDIEAIGNVVSNVGITDAVIRCQGDLHARYLHNCVVECFGNVFIKNEVFDSVIRCSGRVDSPNCRIISSRIYGKKGVTLAGAGSAKTASCTVVAGTDHHVISLEEGIREQKRRITQRLTDLKSELDASREEVKLTFQKMIEIKIFHDRAKKKRDKLGLEFNKKKDTYPKDKLRQLAKLISDFEKRMETSVTKLKALNKQKKEHDRNVLRLESKIKAVTPKLNREILTLDQTLFAYLEWARDEAGESKIVFKNKAFEGTTLGGVFSSVTLNEDVENFTAKEIAKNNGTYEISFS